ncbi:MAG: hypothetical protein EAZ53_00410 [Bacteroidetes bacterium]|nr:MAG: hypothetical protein EAZ53_00410 [Bacteroidota bacterium]
MKLPAIKLAVEQYTLHQLAEAEQDILNENPLKITILGDDEGEQLTHILASIFIKEEMENKSCDYNTALRSYSSKVRNSIN